MATAHTLEQPGLQTTSWDKSEDLMKKFVVEVHPEGGFGWNAIKSFDNFFEAIDYIVLERPLEETARIYNNFDNTVVWKAEAR